MLDTIQSTEAISKSIQQQKYQYFLLSDNGRDVGYFAFLVSDSDMFHSKLYIRKSCRGKGFGRIALEYMEELSKNTKCEKIWLTVNRYNSAVIDIYKKMGFTIESSIAKDIGGGFIMDDYKMSRLL